MIGPTDCIEKDFDAKWYKHWAKRLGYPAAKHPKFWESAIMIEALKERKMLKRNARSVVFGVGTEQLASLFADMDIYVTATDQDPASEDAKKWDNGQLAKDIKSLYYPDIVSIEKFNKYVTYKSYDMNKDERSFYDKFDFVWHNCVVGHIGSMEKSLKHLERSTNYIKDDGWLVFTTELNISSVEKTIDKDSDTIIWRLQDLERMFERLAKVGLRADRLKLRLGSNAADTRINYDNGAWMTRDYELLNNPDYSEIKIAFANYAITQIMLCFKKTTPAKAVKALKTHKKDFAKNQQKINDHIKINSDLEDYYISYEPAEITKAKIKPAEKAYRIKIEAGSCLEVDIEYINRSPYKVFGFGSHWPMNHHPLVLATSSPINRNSIFADTKWSSPNRPAITFTNLTALNEARGLNKSLEKAGRNDKLRFRLNLKAPNRVGNYTEKFCLVFEGAGAIEHTEVEVQVKVVPEKITTKKKVRSLTPNEYLNLIGWPNSKYEASIRDDFLSWLAALAETDSFRIRTEINPDEIEVFIESFIVDNKLKFKNYDQLKKNIQNTYAAYRIKINDTDNNSAKGADILFVISTPRSGNTAITEALSLATGIPNTSGNIKSSNYSRAKRRMYIKTHISYEDFKTEYKARNEYKVITIVRNPLDSLLSAFRFSQKTAGCSVWLDGKVFPKPFIYKGIPPLSKEFEEWALSDGARAFLDVTYSWIDRANVVITYENFILDPQATIKKAIDDLNIEVSISEVNSATTDVRDNFLVGYYNEHRWSASMNNWQKYIPKDMAEKIYKKHKKVFKKLGYELEYPYEITKAEIINNNKNWK